MCRESRSKKNPRNEVLSPRLSLIEAEADLVRNLGLDRHITLAGREETASARPAQGGLVENGVAAALVDGSVQDFAVGGNAHPDDGCALDTSETRLLRVI